MYYAGVMMSLSQFYYKNNRLQQLRGFYYTVLNGSAVEAAKMMNLHPSAISQQLASLERDLNIELFDKSTRPATLTDDGKRFYEKIVPLVQHMDGVFEEFLHEKGELDHNYLTIGAIHTTILHLLPPIMGRFQQENPDVQISIANIGRQEAIEQLKTNKIDLALQPVIEVPAECEFILVKESKPVLLLSKDNPLSCKKEVTLEDIAPYEFLRMDSENTTMPLFEELLRHYNITWNVHFVRSDWEMMKQFTKHNVGVTIVMDICIEEDDTLVSKSMEKYFPTMSYGFLLKKGKYQRKQVTNFLRVVQEFYKNS